MRIAITGSTGFLGTALVRTLTDAGHDVVRIVRPRTRAEGVRWDPVAGVIETEGLEGLDAIINLAGESIGQRRWTSAQKQRLFDSRILGTRLLAHAITELSKPPSVLINASAIGYYGDRDVQQLDEDSGPGSGFLADLCAQWEREAVTARDAGVRVTLLRTGLVLSPEGGLLKKMVLPFRFGLGARLGTGMQYQSWITLEDHVRAVQHVLEADVAGPVNLVGPNPVTNAEMTRALARALHRPAFLVVPRLAFRMVLGSELADELLGSQRVLPRRLQAAGFQFLQEEIEPALVAMLGRRA